MFTYFEINMETYVAGYDDEYDSDSYQESFKVCSSKEIKSKDHSNISAEEEGESVVAEVINESCSLKVKP